MNTTTFIPRILLGTLVLGICFFLASCGGNSESSETSSEANTQKEQIDPKTSKYMCPMECDGSASNEPGKCPVCGMDLVKRN